MNETTRYGKITNERFLYMICYKYGVRRLFANCSLPCVIYRKTPPRLIMKTEVIKKIISDISQHSFVNLHPFLVFGFFIHISSIHQPLCRRSLVLIGCLFECIHQARNVVHFMVKLYWASRDMCKHQLTRTTRRNFFLFPLLYDRQQCG